MAMSAVADDIVPVDATFAEMMGFCLQCRACEAVCPSLAPFGGAMEGARTEVAVQLPDRKTARRGKYVGRKGLGSRGRVASLTRLAAIGQRLGAARWFPGRMAKSLGGLRRLTVTVPSTVGTSYPARGDEIGTAAVLAGCVMDPWFPDVRAATIDLLTRAGYRVEVPEAQTCCGALAAHDGAADEARALAARNTAAFAGFDLLVADAAGCSAHLKQYSHWADAPLPPVRDITEVVAEAIGDGRLPTLDPTGAKVAVQDPCHLRHAQRITEQPRAILRAGGYEVVEIDPDGMCCGAAGVYSILRPATSGELGRRKAEQVRTAGPSVVASANPGCEMQLRLHLAEGHFIAHPIELYAAALPSRA